MDQSQTNVWVTGFLVRKRTYSSSKKCLFFSDYGVGWWASFYRRSLLMSVKNIPSDFMCDFEKAIELSLARLS